MKLRILLALVVLTSASLIGVATAQQTAPTVATAIVPPAVDEDSLAALAPLIKQRNDLQTQLATVTSAIRVVQSAALGKAKLDSLYWALSNDGTKFQQLRRLPNQ